MIGPDRGSRYNYMRELHIQSTPIDSRKIATSSSSTPLGDCLPPYGVSAIGASSSQPSECSERMKVIRDVQSSYNGVKSRQVSEGLAGYQRYLPISLSIESTVKRSGGQLPPQPVSTVASTSSNRETRNYRSTSQQLASTQSSNSCLESNEIFFSECNAYEKYVNDLGQANRSSAVEKDVRHEEARVAASDKEMVSLFREKLERAESQVIAVEQVSLRLEMRFLAERSEMEVERGNLQRRISDVTLHKEQLEVELADRKQVIIDLRARLETEQSQWKVQLFERKQQIASLIEMNEMLSEDVRKSKEHQSLTDRNRCDEIEEVTRRKDVEITRLKTALDDLECCRKDFMQEEEVAAAAAITRKRRNDESEHLQAEDLRQQLCKVTLQMIEETKAASGLRSKLEEMKQRATAQREEEARTTLLHECEHKELTVETIRMKGELKDAKEKLKTLVEEAKLLKDELQTAMRTIKRLEEQTRNNDEELRRAFKSRTHVEETLESRKRESREGIDRLERQCSQQVRESEAKWMSERAALEQRYDRQIRETEESCSRRIRDLQVSQRQKSIEVDSAHSRQLEDQLRRNEEKHRMEVKEVDVDIQQLKREHAKALEAQKTGDVQRSQQLQQALSDAQGKIQASEEALWKSEFQMRKILSEVEEERRGSRQRSSELEGIVQKQSEEIARMRCDFAEVINENTQLSQQFSEIYNENEKLLEELTGMKENCCELESEVSTLQEQCASLLAKCEMEDEKESITEALCERLKGELAQLRKHEEEYAQEFKANEKELEELRKVTRVSESSLEKLAYLQEVVRRQECDIAKIIAVREELSHAVANGSQLQQANCELQMKLAEKNEEAEWLKKEISRVLQELDAACQHIDSNVKLDRIVEDLRDKLTLVISENNRLNQILFARCKSVWN